MDFFRAGRAKTLWKEPKGQQWSFFCPVCRAGRKLNHPIRPTLRHYLQVGLTAVFFNVLTWNWFSWKGLISFVPFWMIFEMVYRTRTRAALGCPQCGFDPFLYIVDAQRAKEEIEEHWRKKFAEKGIPFPERNRPATKAGEKPELAAEGQFSEETASNFEQENRK